MDIPSTCRWCGASLIDHAPLYAPLCGRICALAERICNRLGLNDGNDPEWLERREWTEVVAGYIDLDN